MGDIQLSEFLPWERRGDHPKLPGVYAIAKGQSDNLVYIGLTMSLRRRLHQFHRSATTGQGNHAGGVTYNKRFGPDVSALLVAVHLPSAINASATVVGAYVQHAERLLILQHVERRGALPACNTV